MSNSNSFVPVPENEPILAYAPGSQERKDVLATYKKMYKTPIEVPLFIGGKEPSPPLSSLLILYSFLK